MDVVGTNAVKKFRLEKLGKGLPFMINSVNCRPGSVI